MHARMVAQHRPLHVVDACGRTYCGCGASFCMTRAALRARADAHHAQHGRGDAGGQSERDLSGVLLRKALNCPRTTRRPRCAAGAGVAPRVLVGGGAAASTPTREVPLSSSGAMPRWSCCCAPAPTPPRSRRARRRRRTALAAQPTTRRRRRGGAASCSTAAVRHGGVDGERARGRREGEDGLRPRRARRRGGARRPPQS